MGGWLLGGSLCPAQGGRPRAGGEEAAAVTGQGQDSRRGGSCKATWKQVYLLRLSVRPLGKQNPAAD